MKAAFTSIALAAALLAANGTAAAANYATAQVIDLATTEDFGNTYAITGTTGKTFEDSYTFDVTGQFDLAASLISYTTNKKFDLDITSFGLYQGATLVAGGVRVSNGPLDVWTLDGLNLSQGAYAVKVGGTFLGNNGGSYSGTINVSPVPEPTTWAMLGLGLAAVGVMSRRRKQAA